jgi:hypothetical protein
MQMPFGKYHGADLEDIPDSYLEWLFNLEDLREPLRSAVILERAARRRDYYDEPSANMPDVQDRVRSAYRELSLKYHPDHGGNHIAQCAINEFYERLRD